MMFKCSFLTVVLFVGLLGAAVDAAGSTNSNNIRTRRRMTGHGGDNFSKNKNHGRIRKGQNHRKLGFGDGWDLEDAGFDLQLGPDKKTPLPKETKKPAGKKATASTERPTSRPTILLESGNGNSLPKLLDGQGALEIKSSSETGEDNSSSGSVISFAMGSLGLVFLILIFTSRKRSGIIVTGRKKLKQSMPSVVSLKGANFQKQGGENFDITGVYKLHSHQNLNAFLKVTGTPWAIRSALIRAHPIHHITHNGKLITMKFKGVPRTTYVIDGPAIKNVVGHRVFKCYSSYYTKDGCEGFEVRKEGLDEGDYNIHMRWSRSNEEAEQVKLTLTAHFVGSGAGRQSVECTQVYHRVDGVANDQIWPTAPSTPIPQLKTSDEEIEI